MVHGANRQSRILPVLIQPYPCTRPSSIYTAVSCGHALTG